MTQTVGMEQLQAMRGAPVYSQEGEEIGSVEELFLDYETDRPEWVAVGTGMLGTKRVLVPVEGATLEGDGLRVPYAKDQVKGSPDIDSDEISQQTEQELAAYYGVGYSEQESDTGLPQGGDGAMDANVSAPDSPGDVASTEGAGYVTRSEEESRVGTEQ